MVSRALAGATIGPGATPYTSLVRVATTDGVRWGYRPNMKIKVVDLSYYRTLDDFVRDILYFAGFLDSMVKGLRPYPLRIWITPSNSPMRARKDGVYDIQRLRRYHDATKFRVNNVNAIPICLFHT